MINKIAMAFLAYFFSLPTQSLAKQNCFYTMPEGQSVSQVIYRLIPGEYTAAQRKKMNYGNKGFLRQVKKLNPKIKFNKIRPGLQINIPCGDELDEMEQWATK